MLFHNNIGFTNAAQCYVTRTLPVLLNSYCMNFTIQVLREMPYLIFSPYNRYFLISLLIAYVQIVKFLLSHAVCNTQGTCHLDLLFINPLFNNYLSCLWARNGVKLQRVMKQTIVLGFTKCFQFSLSYISSVSGNFKITS